MKSLESASRCFHCCLETHPPNILETKGTHTAARKHLENTHQRGCVGIVLCLKLAGAFSFKNFRHLHKCRGVCLPYTMCNSASSERQMCQQHGLDTVSGGLGECCGMSAGKNLEFTNLEIVEQNAFRRECVSVSVHVCVQALACWQSMAGMRLTLRPLQAPGHWDPLPGWESTQVRRRTWRLHPLIPHWMNKHFLRFHGLLHLARGADVRGPALTCRLRGCPLPTRRAGDPPTQAQRNGQSDGL